MLLVRQFVCLCWGLSCSCGRYPQVGDHVSGTIRRPQLADLVLAAAIQHFPFRNHPDEDGGAQKYCWASAHTADGRSRISISCCDLAVWLPCAWLMETVHCTLSGFMANIWSHHAEDIMECLFKHLASLTSFL